MSSEKSNIVKEEVSSIAPSVLTDPPSDTKVGAENDTEAAVKVKAEVDTNAADDDEDPLDEEENFLRHIEDEEQKIDHSHDKQPCDAADAPRLLQDALKKGDVKADDSEEEEKKDEGKNGDENDTSKEKDHQAHQRVSQYLYLFFMRNRWSPFIFTSYKADIFFSFPWRALLA